MQPCVSQEPTTNCIMSCSSIHRHEIMQQTLYNGARRPCLVYSLYLSVVSPLQLQMHHCSRCWHTPTHQRQTEPAPSRPRSALLRAVAADVLLLHCVHQTCLQCSRKLKAHRGCSKTRKRCSRGSPKRIQLFFKKCSIYTQRNDKWD